MARGSTKGFLTVTTGLGIEKYYEKKDLESKEKDRQNIQRWWKGVTGYFHH